MANTGNVKFTKEELLLVDEYGNIPLHLRADEEDVVAIRDILESAVHHDVLKEVLVAKDQDGETALTYALLRDKTESVKEIFTQLFKSSKTNPYILEEVLSLVNNAEMGPLHIAVAGGIESFNEVMDIAKTVGVEEEVLLFKGLNDNTVLHFAIYEDSLAVVNSIREIVKDNAGLKEKVLLAKDSVGNIPLHIVVENANADIAKSLMSVDNELLVKILGTKNTDSNTAFQDAILRGHKEVTKAMYDKVFSSPDELLSLLSIINDAGSSPLLNMALSSKDEFKAIYEVVDQDASLKAKLLELKDANGKTLRDLMTDEKNTELASYLEGKEDIIFEQKDSNPYATGTDTNTNNIFNAFDNVTNNTDGSVSYLESAKSAVINFFGGGYEPVNNTAGSFRNTTSEPLAPIETNNVLQHMQYAAVETFAKSAKTKLDVPFVRVVDTDTTVLQQRYDAVLRLYNDAPETVPQVGGKGGTPVKVTPGRVRGKNTPVKVPVKTKGDHSPELNLAKKALDDTKATNLKNQKDEDFAIKAPVALKSGVLASQFADTVEDVAYFLGYENSQIVRNTHDVLKIGSGLAISYASGNKGVVLSSALQTHVVENGIKSIESSYQLNSLVVDGAEIFIGTVAGYLVGGIPYALASLAFTGANVV
jgi:ankyrin repeat protein